MEDWDWDSEIRTVSSDGSPGLGSLRFELGGHLEIYPNYTQSQLAQSLHSDTSGEAVHLSPTEVSLSLCKAWSPLGGDKRGQGKERGRGRGTERDRDYTLI